MQTVRSGGRGSQVFALGIVLAGLAWPSTAWGAIFSGASVGADGTVYGWGVTDVTTGSYVHTAYVTTTLRSPNGRTAIRNWVNARNSVRADVSLAWDSTDLGEYTSTSTHKAYCTQMGWFVNGATSNAPCTVYEFTVTLSPTTVAPLNSGTPNTTTVTVQTNPFVSRSVTLQDVRIAGSGGHPNNHPATLPTGTGGTFSPTSGTTSSATGRFTSTYTAPIFSGEHQIKATMEGRANPSPIILRVMVSGLGQLPGGGNYYNSNSPAGQIAHPDNWWGTSATLNGLVGAATACAGDNNCNGSSVPYNDISLLWGGKFDGNSYNWTGGHAEHRDGKACDVNVCELPWTQTRKDRLATHFYLNGAQNPLLDECQDPSKHTWHVRW